MSLVSVPLIVAACQSVGVHGHDVAGPGDRHGGAASAEEEHSARESSVIALGDVKGVRTLSRDLKRYPVVLVGETHDRYAHHLGQLEIIKGLVEAGADLAIGMEMFQQPHQPVLDDYIEGRIGERELLNGTEWFDRWVYDYRLYRPILLYARDRGIPLVALNIEKEIVGRVSEVGIAGLAPEERERLPARFDGYTEEHRQRLRQIYERHAGTENGDFQRFLEVQETWDQGMAERASDYLKAHPGRGMVVLAGSGHLMFDAGIPSRVERYLGVETAVILPGDDLRVAPGIADFIIYPGEAELPPKGVMGLFLGEGEGGVEVKALVPDSPGEAAGIEQGDLIREIEGVAVSTPGELKAILMGRRPGDVIRLKLRRDRFLRGESVLEFEFPLGN